MPHSPPLSSLVRNLGRQLRMTAVQAFGVWAELMKIMVPVVVAVKLLQAAGAISWLALPLSPLMGLVGLPGEMGLVLATGLVNNIYSAMVVLIQLVQDVDLTAAQATVLATMLLMAHGLPVELSVVRKAGPAMWFQFLARVGGAFATGAALHQVYARTGLLQEEAVLVFRVETGPQPWWEWALGEAVNLAGIFAIILGLLLFLRLLERIGVIGIMNLLLGPVLRLVGIGPRASSLAVIGLTLGVSYGGGLLISESRSGRLEPREIFYSLTLMGVCHSLVEDTILMMLIGGHLSGILWGRLAASLLLTGILVLATRRLSRETFTRLFWAGTPPEPER